MDNFKQVPIEELLQPKEEKRTPGIWHCSKCEGSGSLYERTCPICDIPTSKTTLDKPRSVAPVMCGVCGGSSPAMMNVGGAAVCMGCQRVEF